MEYFNPCPISAGLLVNLIMSYVLVIGVCSCVAMWEKDISGDYRVIFGLGNACTMLLN